MTITEVLMLTQTSGGSLGQSLQAKCQVIGVTSSVRKSFEPVMNRADQISLQRPITTVLAVFATEADALLATVTYARQTRRPSSDTWPLTIDTV